MPYDPKHIEPKWQQYWEVNGTFAAEIDLAKPKFYILDMFPYPSGQGLHVGHPEGYTATDIVARYKRMRGFNVLHPMGWDAYGLPAERYAVRTGVHPAITTKRNIETFRAQVKQLGFSYDWSRELSTTDHQYVRWTQWIFLKLFERGLAYQAEVPVSWCPAQGTVLANEEVKDGKYVETGDPVEKRLMRQWMLRITEYAACWKIWKSSTGRTASRRCSVTGSAARRGRKSHSPSMAPMQRWRSLQRGRKPCGG